MNKFLDAAVEDDVEEQEEQELGLVAASALEAPLLEQDSDST